MAVPQYNEMSDIERELQARFDKANALRFSSTAGKAAESEYGAELMLPEGDRGPIPFTKEELMITENPLRVQWEREVRKFLKLLTNHTSHRITAPMIYEWATGIKIKDLEATDKEAAEKGVQQSSDGEDGPRTEMGKLNVHLRHINWVLREYFGKPYRTKIMGRDVGRAYTVRQEFKVARKKPACMTLWPEWYDGTLVP